MNHHQDIVKDHKELAIRLIQGDESSLEAILRDIGGSVAIALRRKYQLLTEQDVEDVLAIAIHRLWKFRSRFQPEKASLRAFFYRVADHVACDVFRHGWYQAKLLETRGNVPEEIEARIVKQSESLTLTDETKLLQQDLAQVIEKLPIPYRKIVMADAYAKDRVASAKYLADELEISEGTVRVYRSKAMKTIRAEMSKLGHEFPQE